MATAPYTPPTYGIKAFNCPHCNAYAHQIWSYCYVSKSGGGVEGISELVKASCSHCNKYTLWHFEKMFYPPTGGIEPPNPDLSEEIKMDYQEAVSIVNQSPRGAAALLRLCI